MGIRGPGKSAGISTAIDSVIASASLKVKIKKWFTDIESVKKMYTAVTKQNTISNEEEILGGYAESQLDFGNIVEDSERIKIRKRALGPDTIVFSDASYQNLSHDDIISGSVLATNVDQDVELTEGIDYEIDYTSGKIRRILNIGEDGDAKSSGAGSDSVIESVAFQLSVENQVQVAYEYFEVKTKDFDYSINYERGSLSRREGGTIQSGTKIYADYKIRDLVKDEALALSIDQAHAWLVLKIGNEYEGQVDDNLKYGEAYLALHFVSKLSAANLIYEKRNDDIEEAAKELKLISDDYRKLALSYLQPYIKFPGSLHAASINQNRA